MFKFAGTIALLFASAAHAQLIGGSVIAPDFNMISPVISGGSNTAPSNTVANYLGLEGGSNLIYANNNAQVADSWPVAGRFSNLSVKLPQNVAGSTGASYTIALAIAGSASALTCTVPLGQSTCSYSERVNVNAGDKVAWIITPSASPNPTALTTPPGINISALFTAGVQHLRSAILMGTNAAVSANTFVGPGRIQSTTEINVSAITTAGQIQALFAAASNTPGGTETYTMTLEKNGSDTAVTCQIGSAAQTCSDVAHTVSFSVGDTASCKIVIAGTGGTARNIACGFSWNPTTQGRYLAFSNAFGGIPAQNVTRYINLVGASVADATESNVQQLPILVPSPHSLTMQLMEIAQSAASATVGRTVSIRANGVSEAGCTLPTSASGVTIGGIANTPACRDMTYVYTTTSASQPLMNIISNDVGDTGSAPTWFKTTFTGIYQ